MTDSAILWRSEEGLPDIASPITDGPPQTQFRFIYHVARVSSMFRFGAVSIPAGHVFLRSDLSVAFVNISPVLPGHVLVRA